MRTTTGTVTLTALGCAVALAACGSSGHAGSGPRANAGLKFAACMRSHGVPNFPDPSGGGGIQIPVGSGINPRSPAFQSAQRSCASCCPAAAREGSRHQSRTSSGCSRCRGACASTASRRSRTRRPPPPRPGARFRPRLRRAGRVHRDPAARSCSRRASTRPPARAACPARGPVPRSRVAGRLDSARSSLKSDARPLAAHRIGHPQW